MRDGEERFLSSEDVRGICSVSSAEDPITNFELMRCGCRDDSVETRDYTGPCGFCGGRGGKHDACEFHAGDPWERRLVLVFSLDLEEVEEAGAAGVDFDQVFIW